MKIPKKFYKRLKEEPVETGAELFWVVCKKAKSFKRSELTYFVLNSYIAKDKSPCATLNDADIFVYLVENTGDNQWDGEWFSYPEFHKHFMRV